MDLALWEDCASLSRPPVPHQPQRGLIEDRCSLYKARGGQEIRGESYGREELQWARGSSTGRRIGARKLEPVGWAPFWKDWKWHLHEEQTGTEEELQVWEKMPELSMNFCIVAMDFILEHWGSLWTVSLIKLSPGRVGVSYKRLCGDFQGLWRRETETGCCRTTPLHVAGIQGGCLVMQLKIKG